MSGASSDAGAAGPHCLLKRAVLVIATGCCCAALDGGWQWYNIIAGEQSTSITYGSVQIHEWSCMLLDSTQTSVLELVTPVTWPCQVSLLGS